MQDKNKINTTSSKIVFLFVLWFGEHLEKGACN
jgi:hypothetical protein